VQITNAKIPLEFPVPRNVGSSSYICVRSTVAGVQSAWLALCLVSLWNVAALSPSWHNETGFLSHLGSLFNLKF